MVASRLCVSPAPPAASRSWWPVDRVSHLLHLQPVDHGGEELVVVHHPVAIDVHVDHQLLNLAVVHGVPRLVQPQPQVL
eukprot:4081665-Pyramimonas_sp.AAC.1